VHAVPDRLRSAVMRMAGAARPSRADAVVAALAALCDRGTNARAASVTAALAHRVRNGWRVVAEDSTHVYVVEVHPNSTRVLVRVAKT